MNLAERIQSRYCLNLYHRYRDIILFSGLFLIITFLVCWATFIQYKLGYLEYAVQNHEILHTNLIRSQIILINEIESIEGLPKEAKEKLIDLQNHLIIVIP